MAIAIEYLIKTQNQTYVDRDEGSDSSRILYHFTWTCHSAMSVSYPWKTLDRSGLSESLFHRSTSPDFSRPFSVRATIFQPLAPGCTQFALSPGPRVWRPFFRREAPPGSDSVTNSFRNYRALTNARLSPVAGGQKMSPFLVPRGQMSWPAVIPCAGDRSLVR